VEDQMERSTTGVNGDPNHICTTKSSLRQDDQQSGIVGFKYNCHKTLPTKKFQPMRIVFETKILGQYSETVMQLRLIGFESSFTKSKRVFGPKTLSVVPVSSNLKISSAS
jgi:hypothetical protein